jgi:raffinose/stachyose/melibiose transport system permease protein
MTIRLNKVTRDLNVGITTVVDFLQKKGYTVEANPNTKITEEQYAALVKEFSKDKDLKIESEKIIQERQNKERNKASVSIEDIHPELKKPEVIETVVPEDVRPKFKPVGKIDLDGLKKKKKPVLWIVLSIVAIIQIFPLIWLLDFSLASSNEMFTSGLLIIPKKIQWGNYVKAFVDGNFLHYLKNSVLINGLAVVLVILISIMAAFACRRMNWKLSGLVKTLLLMGMMIPIHATLLPNYKIYSQLGMTDTIWALLIPYVAFSLPQGLFLMTSFMEAIPVELEEAAVMDGCGIYRILFQIITPMLKSSIATVAIMTFLNNWNEFMMATTYLSSPKWKTLPFSVLEFTGEYSSNYAVQFAVMALTAAPAVIVYIALNKHITKGAAMGAVKG